MTFLFIVQILCQSKFTMFLLGPCETMKSLSPSIVMPLRRMPRTVGNRGSSHPDTTPALTSFVSFLFDMSVRTNWILENVQIYTGRRSRALRIHLYCASW